MDAINILHKELGITKNYIKVSNERNKDRASAIVHREWIVSLLKNNAVPKFIHHESLSGEEIQSLLLQDTDSSFNWQKILVQVVDKPKDTEQVIALPRSRMPHSIHEPGLSYPQLLHYISDTNYKNLWKHSYKKYLGDQMATDNRDNSLGNLTNTDKYILHEVLKRFYNCKIIPTYQVSKTSKNFNKEVEFDVHSNLLPALCIIESASYFLILYLAENLVTLKDCISFSPTILNSDYARPLFVIYQLLQVMKDSHDRGLVIGNIRLDDIFISNSLFIQVIPNFKDNICRINNQRSENGDIGQSGEGDDGQSCRMQPKRPGGGEANIFRSLSCESNLHDMCDKWISGEITNFEYLMFLNRVSGRRFGDPSCHFIMPWVTDFATRSNGNWRDLSKSKFRLNKGDRQLDLTYESAVNSSQTPHHVSDMLSEITYYVYLSRRTPRSVLCKYVRSIWVPAEYPSSIQRLQEWTPDECIPEFFCDPTVFKSIHDDLPDLELPSWALTPEEFIEVHRGILESKHVSDRLHHWIDLTFGYKLSGSAAVKSKNVCLQLVDSHTTLTTSGIVQLFSYPHPQKKTQVPFFDKVPPKLLLGKHAKKKSPITHAEKGGVASEDEGHSSGNGEDDSFGTRNSPLVLSKLISRSKGSLLAPFQSSSEESTRTETTKSTSSTSQSSITGTPIILPKEYNPTALLTSVENVQNFFRKTFLHQKSIPMSSETSSRSDKAGMKQVVATNRIQEMQILGCLIVELFLQSKLRVMDTSDLGKRIRACSLFLGSDALPRCVRLALSLLLQTSKPGQFSPFVTGFGLPPPSAHQLLQPLLSSFLFPFPSLFPVIYTAICNLQLCERTVDRFELINGCRSDACEGLDQLKVKQFNASCKTIWREILSTRNDQIIELLMPYVKDLIATPSTSKLSVILMLNKVSQCLGPRRTVEYLLDTLINLYNSRTYNACSNIYLYHKHFLLILIIRCGLKVFLDNFIAPLIEATGRYKDSSSEMWSMRTVCAEQNDNDLDIALSPLEEDSSPDVDSVIDLGQSNQDGEVEVFFFDKESTPPPSNDEAVKHAVEHLDLNFSSDLEQLSQDEGDASPSKNQKDVRSTELMPSIAVQNNLVTSIECEVGSKSSELCSSGHGSSSEQTPETGADFERIEEDVTEMQVCEVAKNSIVWLSHRLGPVLTSRHIVRNLLRMLSLCYTGRDNLEQIPFVEGKEEKLWKLSIIKWKVVGDKNVEMVLQALGEIVELYGEQIILVQYLPFMSDLICLSKRKFTLSLEGGIIGCLSLLSFIIPYINDNTLMDQLQDVILKTIIHPAVRLASSTRFCFPSGHSGRYTLVAKLVDTMYLISLRIGAEMTRVHLAVPSLQRYFLAFDKAHDVAGEAARNAEDVTNQFSRSHVENKYHEIQRDGRTSEWSVKDVPGQPITIAHVKSHESLDSSSPVDADKQDNTRFKALAELKSVFNAQLAHLSYLAFFRFLGDAAMEHTVKNQVFIRELCFQYEKVQTVKARKGWSSNQTYLSDYLRTEDSITQKGGSGSFGSNVSVVGNKIELQSVDVPAPTAGVNGISDSEVVSLVSKKIEDSNRYLRGNWLAYWEHEIGRSEKDNRFNFKQIKLQVFNGHSNSVRMIQSLDNENSFISGSKDKTVKLWSLRSQGDGNTVSSCQYTYGQHRKSLLSLAFIQSIRLIASCDSAIHLWDPFEGKTISVLENTKVAPINILKALNPPSVNVVAATTDAALKVIDTRLCSYVSEYKISLNSVGLVRSICVSPSGNWVATGQATGLLTILDLRTGMVLASWKGHEAEILQLTAVNDNTLLSSSLDQTVAAWNVSDGKFKFYMKGPAEPVHCLSIYNSELITGTTANRIGVHTSIDSHASFSSTKLRSDAFRGILTSMTVLPLNRLLLLGADTGHITLLC